MFCEARTPVLYKMFRGDKSMIRTENMKDWFDCKDPGIWNVLENIIDEMARIAVNSITMINPEKVIIYGAMFEFPQIVENFQRMCRFYDPTYKEDYIVTSKVNDRIAYIGSLAIVVNELFLMTQPVYMETEKRYFWNRRY